MASIVRLKCVFLLLLQITTLTIILNKSLFLMTSHGVSGYSMNGNNILTNQLPRFNMPHGNLSYFRSPYWEVLYLLKFKSLPFHSTTSSSINRPLLQRIQSFIGSEGSNRINKEHDDFQNTNYLISDDTSRPELYEPYGDNIISKKTKIIKNIKLSDEKKFPKKMKIIRVIKKLPNPILVAPDPYLNYYNMMDEYKGNRVGKQIKKNYENNRGFGGIYGEPDGMGGELAAETTINRKVNRKFQTQGWK